MHSVVVVSRAGSAIDGALSSDSTSWVSNHGLVPKTRYVARIVVSDANNDTIDETLRFAATDTKKHVTALITPGDGERVGVGSPIVVSFSRPVPEHLRARVERRLTVQTKPAVIGAWHWMNDQTVHWRPPTYWRPYTRVTVTTDLNSVYLGGGVWGSGKHTSKFRIGDSHISRVDVARHYMYVYDNRKLIKTFPISAGRDKYPTKSGVHITFEKSQVVTMDSATVGIPRNSPDGYYEKVYWDVRISYGGAFVHAAPWSVAEQGLVNVSHGCVNISTDNAIWFYNFSLRGDIVDVYNSPASPDLGDPGMADWNMTWKEWLAGSAAPSAAARALHPSLPRASEPAAPGAHTSNATHSPSPSPSPAYQSPTPSPSPTPRRTPH